MSSHSVRKKGSEDTSHLDFLIHANQSIRAGRSLRIVGK